MSGAGAVASAEIASRRTGASSLCTRSIRMKRTVGLLTPRRRTRSALSCTERSGSRTSALSKVMKSSQRGWSPTTSRAVSRFCNCLELASGPRLRIKRAGSTPASCVASSRRCCGSSIAAIVCTKMSAASSPAKRSICSTPNPRTLGCVSVSMKANCLALRPGCSPILASNPSSCSSPWYSPLLDAAQQAGERFVVLAKDRHRYLPLLWAGKAISRLPRSDVSSPRVEWMRSSSRPTTDASEQEPLATSSLMRPCS